MPAESGQLHEMDLMGRREKAGETPAQRILPFAIVISCVLLRRSRGIFILCSSKVTHHLAHAMALCRRARAEMVCSCRAPRCSVPNVVKNARRFTNISGGLMKRFSVREAILVAIAVSLTVLVSKVWSRWHVPKLDTPYQAVLLTNNTVYIGRLQGFGTPYPVMRDVFYIQTRVNPETKQAGNALVRRETTWHSPTYIGRLQGFGTPYPVMRDVFYIQTRVNPETKQAGNALVRRETTWHSPTYMIWAEKQIVMIEPVGKNSRVAELINENSKQ